MRVWAIGFTCILVLCVAAPSYAQQTGPRTLENLLNSDNTQKPAAAAEAGSTDAGPKRPAGTVKRPKGGVQHPDLDKAWADYDAAVTKAAEGIRAAINKQFDAATEKGDLDAADKWQTALEKFEKAGEVPTEKEVKAAVSGALAELKKAGEELTKGYEAVVKNLTIEKKIAEARAARDECGRFVKQETPAVLRKNEPAVVLRKEEPAICPGLGARCKYVDGDWSGHWVRRQNTNVFDCMMFHGPARETATYVATLEVDGENVVVTRSEYRSDKYGRRPPEQWVWRLGKDGKSICAENGALRISRVD